MPNERNKTKDAIDAPVRSGGGIGLPEDHDADMVCDVCGEFEGGTVRGSPLEVEGEHVVGDVAYEVRVCSRNPEHRKLVPKG